MNAKMEREKLISVGIDCVGALHVGVECFLVVQMSIFSRYILPVALGFTVISPHAMADESSLYIAGGAGLSVPRDLDLDGGGIDTSVDLDTGPAALFSLGYGVMENFRGEIELGFRTNDADSVGGASASGNADAWSLMFNGLYDFDTGSKFTPYIGLGVGGARVSADGIFPVSGTRVDDSDIGLAFQGIVGAAYELSDSWSATADYRYLSAPDLDFGADNGTSLDSSYDNHSFMIGLRYSFPKPKAPIPMVETVAQVSEPAPEPVPVVEPVAEPVVEPPVVARSYIVFFDWDRADLLPDAQSILAQAAANAQLGGISSIVATGHADRSGTDSYNLKLSKRRAEAVQAELNRLGVPSSEIAVDWKGEQNPLVPTGDGVREPQNRRVEIVFP